VDRRLAEHNYAKYTVRSRLTAAIDPAFAQVEPAVGARKHAGLMIRCTGHVA